MKRIAILGTRGIPARYGGFETFAEELGSRLVERGVEVTVFCEWTDEEAPPAKYRGIELCHVRALPLGPLTTVLFDLRTIWRARKRFDVVYMLGYGASIFCFFPRLYGTQVWINMDGVEWRRSKWSWPARTYLRLMESVAMWTPNRIIADAPAIRSHLSSRHRHMPECTVIAYGADTPAGSPPESPLDEWGLVAGEYYIAVCRVEPENHVLEIMRGYASSPDSRPLVVVGDISRDSPYVRALREVRDPRIRLVGAIYDRAKLRSLRFHARAYFHGHSVGGTNPSLLEAMACGNAVIAHDNVFNREVASDAALYFRCAADIPNLMAGLAAAPDRLAFMKASAGRRIEERYTWHAIADSYMKLLSADGAHE